MTKEPLRGLSSAERRRMAIDQLVDVADAITSELVVGVRADRPGVYYVVDATRMLCWRDGVRDAAQLLERRRRRDDERTSSHDG